MKNPTFLFAFIALAAGIVASGLVGVCAVNGEVLGCSLSHEFKEQRERILPSLTHADTGIAVMFREVGSASIASSFGRSPREISWRHCPVWTVPVRRFMPLSQAAFLTLSRTARSQVSTTDDGFSSAVATAFPELRFVEAQNGPFTETLSGHIDDARFVITCTAHGGHAVNEVVSGVSLLRSADALTEPFVSASVGNDRVFPERHSSQITKTMRSCHDISPSEGVVI